MFDGEIEADESYSGGQRKGERSRGAAGKTAVFGLLKRNGRVYTVAAADKEPAALLPLICKQIKPDSIVCTDFYKSQDFWNRARRELIWPDYPGQPLFNIGGAGKVRCLCRKLM